MADPKGFRLYVNLGASQTRRRLKAFGHGVRKVQSAGRGQAIVIHTATGRHLEELEEVFADVGCARTIDSGAAPSELTAQTDPQPPAQIPPSVNKL